VTNTGIVLRFPLADVITAAEDATNATQFRAFYDHPDATGPHLVLTAQYGIYLMSNALKPEGTTAVRAFAEGWHENTDPAGYLPYCGVIDVLPLNEPDAEGGALHLDALRADAENSTHLVITFDHAFTHYETRIV
jgi:hypothetical protein